MADWRSAAQTKASGTKSAKGFRDAERIKTEGTQMAPGWRNAGQFMNPGQRTGNAPAGDVPVATPRDGLGADPYSGNRSTLGQTNGAAWGSVKMPGAGVGGADGAGAVPGNPYGSQSGPGILESWFNQRATGTDPAMEYAMKRGMEGLGNQYSAAGAYNSGAARQGESDLAANIIAQRMGQLDALAGGASGEHQGRLNSMFAQGLALAGGQSGLASAYDLGAAGNMSAANDAMNRMFLTKAGVDQAGNQGAVNLFTSIFGGRGGGQTR